MYLTNPEKKEEHIQSQFHVHRRNGKKILYLLGSNIPSLLTTHQNAKTTRLLLLQKEDLTKQLRSLTSYW